MENFYNSANHLGFNYTNPTLQRAPISENNFKLATIYVKPQVYNGVSAPLDALKQGTAFVELYSPYVGKGGVR